MKREGNLPAVLRRGEDEFVLARQIQFALQGDPRREAVRRVQAEALLPLPRCFSGLDAQARAREGGEGFDQVIWNGGKGVFRGRHAEMDAIFRSLRQAVNAAVYNPVVGIVNDRRAVNGFQIYFIRFSIQRNAHLVITGLDSFNIYVRPGGDDPFHRLAIDSIYYFAILIGDLKGIVDLQGSILDRWEIDFPESANSVKTPRARKAGHIGISSVFLARQREIDVHSRHIHALGHFLFC